MPRMLTYRKLDRRIKKIERERELKYCDHYDYAIDLTGSSSVAGLPSAQFSVCGYIAPGDESYQRNGNKITLTSFKMKGFVQMNYDGLTNPDMYNHCRFILVKWKDAEPGPPPAIDYILDAPRDGGTIPATTTSELMPFLQYNFLNRNTYKVLWDKTFALSGLAFNADPTIDAYYAANDKVIASFNIKIPLNNLEVNFDPETGDPVDNDLILYAYSDSTASAHPSFHYTWRVYYYDL